MAEQGVTIRAEWLSDIPEKAARDAAAVKAAGSAMRDAAEGGGGAAAKLGASFDDAGDRVTKISTGGMNLLQTRMKAVEEQGSKLRETLTGLGETVHEKLTYPLMQLTWALEGGAAGLAAFGLATYSSLQQAGLQLSMFTGSSATGRSVLSQLMALRDPASLGALEGSFETLSRGGASNRLALQLTRALAGAGAVSGQSDALLGSASSAIQDVLIHAGKISGSDMFALQQAFPQFFNILGRDVGTSGAALRVGAAYDQSEQLPSNLWAQLEATPQARNGLAAYGQTFEGELGRMKTSVGDFLAVLERPLGEALGSAASKLDQWASQTEKRFGAMSGTLSKDWKDGDITGFSTVLAKVLGDPKLSGDIDSVTLALRGMGNIITGSVIPAGRDLIHDVNPALRALGDTLGFLGRHTTATKDIIEALGGFYILSKIAKWGDAAASSIGGFAKALTGLGGAEAEASIASGGGGSAVAGAAAGAEGGAAGGLGLGGLASAAVLGIVGVKSYELSKTIGQRDKGQPGDKTGLYNEFIGNELNSIGTFFSNPFAAFGGGAPSPANAADQRLAEQGALGAAAITVNGTINVTIPGNGNPEKVANSIPKGINAQINAFNLSQARRSAKK